MTLYPRLAEGVGVDLSIDPNLSRIPRLSFVESTLEEALPGFPSGAFDLVLMISVLEHLWDPQWTLEQCWRALREGGTLLVNVPTWLGKSLLEYSAFRVGASPPEELDDHKMYYNKRDLWPLLVRAGFKPSQIRTRYHKFGLNLFAVAQKMPVEGRH
jgi:SAM-dependent methyltransferase